MTPQHEKLVSFILYTIKYVCLRKANMGQ